MLKKEGAFIPEPLALYNERRRGKRKNKVLTEEELVAGVVGICSGKLSADESKKGNKNRVADHVLQVYLEKYATFWGKRKNSWRKTAAKSKGALGCCSRAAIQASLLSCSVEDYMEAQFWFFNEVFARPPTYADIAGPGGLLRYKQWRMACHNKTAPRLTINKATGGIYVPGETLPSVVLAYENKVLERMSLQWGGEHEVWILFGSLGDEEVFSDSFKKTREIWRNIYLKGEKL